MIKNSTSISKRNAANTAVLNIKSNTNVGIGSGTTVYYLIEELKQKTQEGKIVNVNYIPTSFDTEQLLSSNNLPIIEISSTDIDLVIDGADEVSKEKRLIKGGGGALLREKIVYNASKEKIIIVDSSKIVEKLGESFALPVEIAIFGWKRTMEEIKRLGKIWNFTDIKLRKAQSKLGPIVTDNNNFIVDIELLPISKPNELDNDLLSIAGVLATGLFVNPADKVIIGYEDRTEII